MRAHADSSTSDPLAAHPPPASPTSAAPSPAGPDPDHQLRLVLGAMADAVVVVDERGVVQYANPAAARLLGRASLSGQPFGLPVVVGESSEVDLLAQDGTPRIAEMRVVAIQWDGSPAVLAALRDITERRQAEEARYALVREQAARAAAESALRDRDTLLSVAAHELKTPLTSLTVAVQLLLRLTERRALPAPETLVRHLSTVNLQARKLAEMVGRVLDSSRAEVGRLSLQREPADLVGIIESATSLVASEAGRRTIRVRNEAGMPIIAPVDRLRLEQVLTNLLDNAIKFSPDGSEIVIDVARFPSDVRISVRDRGLGIPPQDRERVFERFYQAHDRPHSPGLGLGLFICKQIVELHGGSIEALGPEDGGTIVRVTLPIPAPR